MKPYHILLTKEAVKDVRKLTPRLREKLKAMLVNHLALDPFSGKKLAGDLDGFYSLRLTYQDRIVYTIDETSGTVIIHRARTHYGD